MRICPLVFSKNDRTRLYELHEQFVHQLENGRGLQQDFFIDLKQALRELLLQQKELQGFWQEVSQFPDNRYHLHITHKDKSILNLPWQIAIDHPSIYLSKGLPLTGAFEQYEPQAGPLRILVMISSPEDLDYKKRLSYEEEEQVILRMLAPLWQSGQVQVEFTEDGSLHSLQAQLQLQHYHILYFSGHGSYEDNTGYLYLEDAETLSGELISAQQLGEVMKAKPEHTPTLVILSACQTGKGDMKDGFRGIADELIHMGVPAVIAMAFSIQDDYAILFASHLYQHLSLRLSLGEAYSKAVSAMQLNEQQELLVAGVQQYFPSQWLIPQLYCSQQVVQLVDWHAQGQVLKVSSSGFIGGEEFLLLSPDKQYRFIGRRRENAFLFSKLVHNEPVLIRGQGGVGKTSLAEHLAKRLISQDPSRYCFAFNETNTSVSEIAIRLHAYLEREGKLSDIAPVLHKTEDTFIQAELLLQQVVKVCKPLWIFDNVESFQQDIDGPLKDEYVIWLEFVQEHLLHQCPVIFTGRYPVAELGNIADISLNQVSFVDFYRKCLQLSIGTNTDEQDQATFIENVSLLYHVLGGSYRVLEFFDELYINDRSHVQELLKQMQLLQAIHERQGKDGKKIVIAALLRVLNEDELITFHLLLFFRTPVLQRALEMQFPGKQYEAHLQRLKDLTLIEEHSHKGKPGQVSGFKFYYITQLVREWLQDYKLPRVEFYFEYAGDYFEFVFKEVSPTYGTKEEAFFYYTQSHNIAKINETGAQIVSEYYRVGLHELVLHFGKKAEAKVGVRIHEEVLNNLGLSYLKFGRFDIALSYLTKFLIAARRMGNKEKEIAALNGISQVYYQQQDLDTALAWLEKSREAAKENQLAESEALTLNNIGNIYADRGQYENALQVWRQSLQVRKAAGNVQGQIRVMINMSGVYGFMNDSKKALQTLQKSLSMAVEAGEQQLENKILTTIGSTYLQSGLLEEALPYLHRALEVSEATDDQEASAEAMAILGTICGEAGNFDEAIEYLAKASTIMQKFGHHDVYLTLSVRLGSIEIARGDHEAGIATLLHCLADIRNSGSSEMESEALIAIGEAYLELRAFDEALRYLQECRIIRQSLGDKEGECMALTRISQVYGAKDDYDETLKCQEQLLAIHEQFGDFAGQAMAYYNIACCYTAKGDKDTFFQYLRKAYSINKQINHKEGLYFTGAELGIQLCSTDNIKHIQEGLPILKDAYEAGKKLGYVDLEYVADQLKKFTEKYNNSSKKGTKSKKE